jgi:hypothetical protein
VGHVIVEILREARQLAWGQRQLLAELVLEEEIDSKKRAKAIRDLSGKYAHTNTSADEFNRRKAEDLDLEEHSGS